MSFLSGKDGCFNMTRLELKELCMNYLRDNYSSARNISGDTIPITIKKSLLERVFVPTTVYEVTGVLNHCIRWFYKKDSYEKKELRATVLEVSVEKSKDIEDAEYIYTENLYLAKDLDKKSIDEELNSKVKDILEDIHRGNIFDENKFSEISEDLVEKFRIEYKVTDFIIFRDEFVIDDNKNYIYRICLPMKVRGEKIE